MLVTPRDRHHVVASSWLIDLRYIQVLIYDNIAPVMFSVSVSVQYTLYTGSQYNNIIRVHTTLLSEYTLTTIVQPIQGVFLIKYDTTTMYNLHSTQQWFTATTTCTLQMYTGVTALVGCQSQQAKHSTSHTSFLLYIVQNTVHVSYQYSKTSEECTRRDKPSVFVERLSIY